MADVIANGNGDTNWDTLPGLQEFRDADPTPANIRWFVDVLNHIMIENYLLRRELLRQRSGEESEDAALYEVTVAAPSTQPDEGSEPSAAGRGPQADRPPGLGHMARPRDRTQRARRAAEAVSHRRGGYAPQPVSRPEHEEVVSQLEALGDEIQSLRTEIRSALSQAPADRRAALISRPEAPPDGPRFEPIRSSRSDLTFEAEPHPGMWMRLRQPWFYLPLIWITLIGLLALAVFFVFLD